MNKNTFESNSEYESYKLQSSEVVYVQILLCHSHLVCDSEATLKARRVQPS